MRKEITINNSEQSLFSPERFEVAMKIAETIAKSDLAPRDFKGKPENVLLAMQMGHEVGLKPMQAIQNIAVINGRPCVWGDAMLALVVQHKDYEWHSESPLKNGEKIVGYSHKIKRRNIPMHEATFTLEDARTAGLLGKSGPWTQYPSRMLQMRARAFALRNTFPDALRGLNMAEEVSDYNNSNKVIPNESAEKSTTSRLINKLCEPIVAEETILATDEQLLEIRKLIELLKVPEEIYKKWLDKANAQTFEEMPKDKIQKCIDALNSKIKGSEDIAA